MYELLRTDVLVVGGGGAGCRAAIEAHDRGADVVAIVKGRVGNSGCTVNVGTSASVGPWGVEGDSNEASMRDLLAHGGFPGQPGDGQGPGGRVHEQDSGAAGVGR